MIEVKVMRLLPISVSQYLAGMVTVLFIIIARAVHR